MDFDFTGKASHPETLKASHQLIDQLWHYCTQLKTKMLTMQEEANTDSSNSSLPPSSDSIKRRAEKRKERNEWHKQTSAYWKGLRQGAQPGHKGVGRALIMIEEVDEIISCYPNTCCDVCLGAVKIGKL